jgi:hypothetical protein
LVLPVARAKAAILQGNAGLTRNDTPDAALDQSIVSHSGDSVPPSAFFVYPGVYQSAIGILQSQHPCGLQPDFGEQVQNIE